jgi:4-aminobutyrate aminotransferase-like enzyme/Ser/Thr protein kinase RdoA (MazF antagonist)
VPSLTADLPFGLDLREATQLPGEVNRNFRLTDSDGRRYLLKLYPAGVSEQHLDLQAALLSHLGRKGLSLSVPTLLQRVRVYEGDQELAGGLYTYLAGTPVAAINPRSPQLFTDWGRCCGELSRALSDFDHPAAHRDYRWDPLRARQIVPEKLNYLDYKQKKLAEYYLQFISTASFPGLPRSVCYNDAHELNLLSEDGASISGVIDFDDVVFTASISELAVGCAYAAMQAADPLEVFRQLVTGYVAVRPIAIREIDALYALILSRLLLTVVHAAESRSAQTGNAYLTVSEEDAWDLLSRLRGHSPLLVRSHLRAAAQLPVHPTAKSYAAWLTNSTAISPVDLAEKGILPIDMAVGSTMLGSAHAYTDARRFSHHLATVLAEKSAELAIGGYGEARPFYEGAAFRGEGNAGRRHRSVHLGLDFWSPAAGVAVRAALSGTVVAAGEDSTPGGYGHVILLRHNPAPGVDFLTLYGHLSGDSVRELRAGTQVQGGQVIGKTGTIAENGGWPPHLHFQVLLDELGYGADFPGVAYPTEADIWLALCPDPCTLIGLAPPETPPGPQPRQLLERRRNRLGYSLSVSYRDPLLILRGWRQHLYDHRGRRYLDTVNNVAHVGHEHPVVVEAASRQAAVLNTNSRYLHPLILEYADALAATLPPDLSVVHFVNSGSEANELALRMARAVTDDPRVLAFEMGYHGNTGGTIRVSSYKFDREGGGGAPSGTYLLPFPDALRERNLDPTAHFPEGVSTFLHETILSCAGQLPLPSGYLTAVYDRIQGAGGVCIADEVQTGLGRTGEWWAFAAHGVVPDIVTMGKPLGNGHPLGAVVCTPRVARAFANGMEYFNTFGGNPVSSATGLAVLNTVIDEGLRERAVETGDYLLAGLGDLRHRHPIIADLRGAGLFLGVELCHSDLTPATPQAAYLANRMRELGILMSTDGPHENVLKIKPPLCFDRNDAEELLHYLDRVLGENRTQI